MQGLIDFARNVTAAVDPYLARIGVFQDTRFYWYLAIGILLIAVLMPRKRKFDLVTLLEVEDFEMESEGLKETSRMREMLCQRPDWGRLPEAFLFDLAARLGDIRNVIDFLDIAHRRRIFNKRLVSILESRGTEDTIIFIADKLAKVVRKYKNDAEKAQYVMIKLNCMSPDPALNVARLFYRRKRYEDALPSLEAAMTACQRLLDHCRVRPALEAESPGLTRKTQAKLDKVVSMYQTCLSR